MSKDSSEQYRPLVRGTVIADRYEVEKYLGESLLGPTYVVRYIERNQLVAIKFIRNEYAPLEDLDEIKELMKKAKAIKHPNVVRYGKVSQFNDMLFFTQEYFPSQNLREVMLEKEGSMDPFSMQEVTEISKEVLSALEAIHEVGIYHTNLKPENILLRYKTLERGAKMCKEIKITDIMVAAILGDDHINASPYRAPECWKGSLPYRGPASDVYSIGNIIYELLTGRPATGTYLHPTQMRDDLNENIDMLIDVALAANPEDRYPSATAMKNNINTYFSDVFKIETSQEANNNVMLAIKVVVALLIVLAVWFFTREPVEDVQTMDVRVEDRALRAKIKQDAKALAPKADELQAKKDKYSDMLYIPAGPVLIGALKQEFTYRITGETEDSDETLAARGELSAKRVDLKEGFFIDRFEWPNRLQDENGNSQEPEVNVTYQKAEEMCKEQGKRLCTSDEWEKACKGFENYIYSYADGFDYSDGDDDQRCSYCMKVKDGTPQPVPAFQCGTETKYRLGDKEECQSSYGVYGMSAGPREWTSSTPAKNDKRAVTKGGSYRGHPERSYRCAYIDDASKGYSDENLSFRCCRNDK